MASFDACGTLVQVKAFVIVGIAIATGACALVRAIPAIASRSRKPPFVVALVIGAVAIAACEVFASAGGNSATHVWPGLVLSGFAARAAGLAHAIICAASAWGLWRLRAWARLLTMGYLGCAIASFLFWGVRGGEEDVVVIMAWQMFVLPLLTFGFMYLQRGSLYFTGA